MFPHAQRLTARREFAAVYRRRRTQIDVLLALHTLPRPDQPGTRRFGFVVSKKVGKAHDRNRIKRRLREICRLRQDLWIAGFDAVIVARNGASAASAADLEAALVQLFAKAGLRRQQDMVG